ncbi:MAG: SpoIIE family protein phosphatase [Prochlorococcaceae cyanobacterium]|jgi:serine phosphatase RsbU (regulator of sigma subunit)
MAPRKHLSIQRTFTLIAVINGGVLLYLIAFNISQLQNFGGDRGSIYVSLLLQILLAILAIISYRIISSRIIRPLARLVDETCKIESGDHNIYLTVRGQDEVSLLAHSFNLLLSKMRQAFDELEASTNKLIRANHQIAESLRYAGLLQRSILPDRQMRDVFGDEHFVLWQPRDTVGGDYYVFHSEAERCLVGVADCAGHGVPGAMMTMLARAGVDRSIQELGIDSPASLLQAIDASMRNLLGDAQLGRAIATSMDMGLALLDFPSQKVRFAGAKIALYWSDGKDVYKQKGGNRAICDRRPGTYEDCEVPLLRGYTYYLTTDGYLDQAGGEYGFGLGSERFSTWLLEHAGKPLPQQREAFSEDLARFRGDLPQRDDVTVLSFRFP